MRCGGALLGLTLAATVASAQSLHYEGSAGLATGSYIFTQRTSSWNVSTGLAFGAGPVTLRAAWPVFHQSTTLVTSTGLGFIPTGGSSSGAVADSSARRSGEGTGRRSSVIGLSLVGGEGPAGDPVSVPSTAVTGFQWALGDPTISASLAGLRVGRVGLLSAITVKVPVVDTADLGSGAWDVGVALSTSLLLTYRWMASLDVSYWLLGDPPGLELSNPLTLGGMVSYLSPGGWGLAAGASGSTPTIPGFAPSISVTGSVLRPGRWGGIGLLTSIGLTETAPDLLVAVTWRVGLLP